MTSSESSPPPVVPFCVHTLGPSTPGAAATDWLWHGYLAAGQLTLLTSLWKSGKTTLLAVLLARMRDGGQLLGMPVRCAKALVLSEEGATLWQMRRDRLAFGENAKVICR